MPNYVPATGPVGAKLLLIGEAPGRYEDAARMPFVGPSGQKLTTWWRAVGLSRADFRIDNVYPYQPPDNDFTRIPVEDREAWTDNLHDRIAALPKLNVIIPTGATALRALLGRQADDSALSITKYRGSILSYCDRNGRTIKVIPTIHPASIFHQQSKALRGSEEKANPGQVEKHCRRDWERIALECLSPKIDLPQREHFINPTASDCEWYLREAKEKAHWMSVDIETPERTAIACVGFSFIPSFSMTIPMREHPEAIRALCALPCVKVLQNGLFDAFWLARAENIRLTNYVWDTMFAHHALDPVDVHDLGTMLSLYIRHAYHKDILSDRSKLNNYSSGWEALQIYCGLDNCTQLELAIVLHEELRKADLLDFYWTHYAKLLPALLDMMLGGIRTDRVARRWRQTALRAECVELQNELERLAGTPLHAKTDLAPRRIHFYLYDVLKLPVQRKRGRKGQLGAATVDEVALRKLQLRYPKKAGNAIRLILDHRRKAKLATHLDDTKCDDDGYMRCQYTPTTEAGRLASSRNPWGTGANLQNVDREVRDTFVPDEGHIFVECDLSQAESRIVFVLSGDDRLIELAHKLPDEYDMHTDVAAKIFGIPHADVTSEQRYFGKRTVHGAQRGLKGETMADKLLTDDYVRTAEECQRMLDNYMRAHPGVQVYFDWVVRSILRHHRLVNSWGRCWDVRAERPDAALYRRAYSFLPQSEVADLLNQWGLIPVHDFVQANMSSHARVVTTVYDSVLISCAPDLAWSVAEFLAISLQRPRTYQGAGGPVELTIPAEFQIGRTWEGDKKWKRLPSRETFEEAVAEVCGSAGT